MRKKAPLKIDVEMQQKMEFCRCGGDPLFEDHCVVFIAKCSNDDCKISTASDCAPEPTGKEPESYWQSLREQAVRRWNRIMCRRFE